MLSVVKSMFGSKKFIAALVTGGVWGLGRLGFHIDEVTLGGIVAPLFAYIIGQGAADKGKEAALINAASSASDIKSSVPQ